MRRKMICALQNQCLKNIHVIELQWKIQNINNVTECKQAKRNEEDDDDDEKEE